MQNVRVGDIFETLQKKYRLNPNQRVDITFDIKEEEDEVVNVGQDLIEGFKEIMEARKKGVRLPSARDLLKEL